MYNFDFNEKAHTGNFKVCVTTAGDVLVMPEFSVLMRGDIAEIVYDTDHGYSFKSSSN